MLIDLSPFTRYPDFRRLYLSQFISFFGFMFLYVALPFQMYSLTHSALHVGNIGLVELIPLLTTSLLSGALADRLNRRKILLITQCGMVLMSAILFWNASLAHPLVWVLYSVAAVNSALSGLYRPVLEAIVQRMIHPKDMASISAVRSFMSAICMVCAPGLAGFLLGRFHISIIYAVNFGGYFLGLLMVLRVNNIVAVEASTEKLWASIKAGLRYAGSRQELMGTYLIDFVAMIFGMPMALFPILAMHVYHDVGIVGWLYAAPAVGAFVISVFSGWALQVKRHGAAIVYSASVWGIAIIIFGVMKNMYVALIFLAVAGAADAVSGMFRTTMWNQTIPHHLRGRLASIEMISYMSGPLLGNAEAGFVAHWAGVPFSIISGGVLCIVGVIVLTVFLPNFWRYEAK
jgi:MFS family permease